MNSEAQTDKWRATALWCIVGLVLPMTAFGHHGSNANPALYFADNLLVLEGEITGIFWRNPLHRRVGRLGLNGHRPSRKGASGFDANEQLGKSTAAIASQGDTPWFIWFGFNLPHSPLHMPPNDTRAGTSHSDYAVMIENMDTQFALQLPPGLLGPYRGP